MYSYSVGISPNIRSFPSVDTFIKILFWVADYHGNKVYSIELKPTLFIHNSFKHGRRSKCLPTPTPSVRGERSHETSMAPCWQVSPSFHVELFTPWLGVFGWIWCSEGGAGGASLHINYTAYARNTQWNAMCTELMQVQKGLTYNKHWIDIQYIE